MNEDIKRYGLAGVIVLALLVGVFLIFGLQDKGEALNTPAITTSSEIVTTDPQLTTSLFVTANGTMGDKEHEVSGDTLFNQVAMNGNRDRRLKSYRKVKEAVIPGGPILNGNEEHNIDKHTKGLTVPVFYEIDNLKTSEPINERKVEVQSNEGTYKYRAVDVLVSFDSTKIYYDRVRDISWDGTYSQIENKETYTDVKVTLVQSGDLWFVYDIENSEHELNARFATWSGVSKEEYDYTKDKVVKSIEVPGFEPYKE